MSTKAFVLALLSATPCIPTSDVTTASQNLAAHLRADGSVDDILYKPLALDRRIAPRCEYATRWMSVRALGDDGVVNGGSFGHVLSRFSARYT